MENETMRFTLASFGPGWYWRWLQISLPERHPGTIYLVATVGATSGVHGHATGMATFNPSGTVTLRFDGLDGTVTSPYFETKAEAEDAVDGLRASGR